MKNIETNNRIREEWEKNLWEEWQKSGANNFLEDTYDWWLSKIDELLKSQKESLVEKITLMIYKNPAWEISEKDKVRNQALQDIISLLNEDNKEFELRDQILSKESGFNEENI